MDSYDYRTADVRGVPPKHRGGRHFPGSRPWDREGVKVANLMDIKAMFDARKERKAVAIAVDKVSPVIPPNSDEESLVAKGATPGGTQRRHRTLLLISALLEKVTL